MLPLTHSEYVKRTSFERLWKLMLEKVEHPDRTIKAVEHVEILEKDEKSVVRLMKLKPTGIVLKERIFVDHSSLLIKYDLMDHPKFSGYFINKVIVPKEKEKDVILTYERHWSYHESYEVTEKDEEFESKFPEILKGAVRDMKALAEKN